MLTHYKGDERRTAPDPILKHCTAGTEVDTEQNCIIVYTVYFKLYTVH